jgi:hypothetical protein
MRIRFEDSCIDVVGVDEIFLWGSMLSRFVTIKGYKFLYAMIGQCWVDLILMAAILGVLRMVCA